MLTKILRARNIKAYRCYLSSIIQIMPFFNFTVKIQSDKVCVLNCSEAYSS